MAQDKSDISFKVIDRRLFTEQGDLRPEAQEQVRREKEEPKSATGQSSTGASTGASAGAPTGTAASPAGALSGVQDEPGAAAKQNASSIPGTPGAPVAVTEGEAPARSPHFEMLLNLVANQAAAMLGAYADPRTGQAVVDLEGAREFIDMLDALREKTRGNLADEEEQTLTDVLGSLKFTFMEMTKASATARAGGAGVKPGSRR